MKIKVKLEEGIFLGLRFDDVTYMIGERSGDVNSSNTIRNVPEEVTWSEDLVNGFDKMRDDYEAQEKAGGHFAGGKKHGGAQTARGMQWRPAGQALVPDRLVAQGPRVA